MIDDDDLPEYTGTDRRTLADPKGERAAPVAKPVKTAPLAEKLAEPAQPVAVAPKPGSHPKHAIARPRREYEAAQQETRDAQSELMLANNGLRAAEIAEGNALAHWLALQPTPDPEKLLHDYAKQQTEQRAANVAAGLPPEGVRPPTHNRSGVDTAAANRPRPSPQIANAPLRSPIARRVV